MKYILSNIFILLLSFFCITTSCTKQEVKEPLLFQKELLAGTGSVQNTQRVWQLDSTILDGINQNLTIMQKQYKKTFTYDGAYFDTDNNVGTWEMVSLNKLKQTIPYVLNNRKDSSIYDIISINAAKLKLSLKLANGQTAIYSFKLVN
jgi:hypothetical protein